MANKVKQERVILYYGKGVMPKAGTRDMRSAYQGDHGSVESAREEADSYKHRGAIDWWLIQTGNYRHHSSWSSK